jgi:hypothetical protein
VDPVRIGSLVNIKRNGSWLYGGKVHEINPEYDFPYLVKFTFFPHNAQRYEYVLLRGRYNEMEVIKQ